MLFSNWATRAGSQTAQAMKPIKGLSTKDLQKWSGANGDPFTDEEKISRLVAPPSFIEHEIDNYIDRKIKDCRERMDTSGSIDKRGGAEAYSELQAWSMRKVERDLTGKDEAVNQKFVAEFIAFLLGKIDKKSPEYDIIRETNNWEIDKQPPVGAPNNREVVAYLGTFLDRHFETMKHTIRLKVMGPDTSSIRDLWLFFKYIVKGHAKDYGTRPYPELFYDYQDSQYGQDNKTDIEKEGDQLQDPGESRYGGAINMYGPDVLVKEKLMNTDGYIEKKTIDKEVAGISKKRDEAGAANYEHLAQNMKEEREKADKEEAEYKKLQEKLEKERKMKKLQPRIDETRTYYTAAAENIKSLGLGSVMADEVNKTLKAIDDILSKDDPDTIEKELEAMTKSTEALREGYEEEALKAESLKALEEEEKQKKDKEQLQKANELAGTTVTTQNDPEPDTGAPLTKQEEIARVFARKYDEAKKLTGSPKLSSITDNKGNEFFKGVMDDAGKLSTREDRPELSELVAIAGNLGEVIQKYEKKVSEIEALVRPIVKRSETEYERVDTDLANVKTITLPTVKRLEYFLKTAKNNDLITSLETVIPSTETEYDFDMLVNELEKLAKKYQNEKSKKK